MVQVYDTQDHSLQVQAYRSIESAKRCIRDVKQQLDDQGGYEYTKPEAKNFAFDAVCDETGRKLSLDLFECWVND